MSIDFPHMIRKVQAGRDSDSVLVALGSNLGDSPRLLELAMDRLDSLALKPVRRSSVWTSTPMECPPGSPGFMNAVVGMTPHPGETPESLLRRIQALEVEFGRLPKRVLNEARPLDLDLIDWPGEVRCTPALTLPHPRAYLRRFVLAPLAELDPQRVLSGQSRTVAELLESAPADPGLRRIAPGPSRN